ncbi:DUF6338 family protein [Actinomadura sp. 6N118]|uniref:DUF6338 family protein n=1 Tax=Actinomadura sp. 6N118 TaxID=3375151 RepID=UPI0037A039A8
MTASVVGQIIIVLLAIVPGLHYDQLRGRAAGPRTVSAPNVGRVILAGVLITTATLVLLGLLGLFGSQTLAFPLDKAEGSGGWKNPEEFAWTIVSFLALSLTAASLADALLSRLESDSASSRGRARSRATGVGAQADEDVELEVRLNSGDTYRGLVAGVAPTQGPRSSYVTLRAPIFELDGHGRPLPLDALHGDQLVLSTESIMSVLVRTVDQKQDTIRSQLQSGQPRHSMARPRVTRRPRAAVRRCYENRRDLHFLSQLLLLEITFLGFVALLSGSSAA